MKHALNIRIARKPDEKGIATVRNLSVRERLLRFLLGRKARLTLIVPGDSVEEMAIKEVRETSDEALRD